jgi:hypothetical protein
MKTGKEGLNDFIKGYAPMFGLLFSCLFLQRLLVVGTFGILFWILFGVLAFLSSFYLFLKTLQPWVNFTVRLILGLPLLVFAILYGIQQLFVLGFNLSTAVFGVFLLLFLTTTILVLKEVVN